MIVYRNKRRMQEAVNFQELSGVLPKEQAKDKTADDLFPIVLKYLRRNGEPIVPFLKAYGTSREEIMAAIELLVKYYNGADQSEMQELEKEFKTKFDVKGKVDRSTAFKLAKQVLEDMDEDDFNATIALEFYDVKRFDYFDEKFKKMFNIDDEEAEKALSDNRSRMKGYIRKKATVQNLKNATKKVKDAVSKKLRTVKDFGNKIRGFFD